MKAICTLTLVICLVGVALTVPVALDGKCKTTLLSVETQFNQDTDISIPASIDPKPSQVSWQSAFWALVPITLNTMTQPSGMILDGMILDMPSRYGFFLRSSPIICFLDTIYVLSSLIYYTPCISETSLCRANNCEA